jgi:hypothetical protein
MKKLLILMLLIPTICFAETKIMVLPAGGPNWAGFGTDIIPATDNTYDLGSTSLRWAELHATIGTLTSTTTHTLGVTDLFVMQPTTDSTTAFTINDTDGGAPVFNVDVTNERVGIGTNSPATALDVNGAITTVSTPTPGVTFIDSDTTDEDDSAIVYANATDTATTQEDVDIYVRQQVAGVMTTTIFSDSDGNLELGTAAQDTEIKGALVYSTITVTAAGPSDDIDVSGVNVVFINASGATVTIGGFVGGVNGQVIQVVRLGTTNDAVLEHNEGGGNQDILLADEGDQTISTYGGWTLVCNGSDWFEVGY